MSAVGSSSAARLYVGGLGTSVTEVDLREAFFKVGVELESIELIMNRATGCSRGFALGVLRRRPAGAPIVTDDDLFQQIKTVVVCGRAVTVLLVPPSSNHRPPH